MNCVQRPAAWHYLKIFENILNKAWGWVLGIHWQPTTKKKNCILQIVSSQIFVVVGFSTQINSSHLHTLLLQTAFHLRMVGKLLEYEYFRFFASCIWLFPPPNWWGYIPFICRILFKIICNFCLFWNRLWQFVDELTASRGLPPLWASWLAPPWRTLGKKKRAYYQKSQNYLISGGHPPTFLYEL